MPREPVRTPIPGPGAALTTAEAGLVLAPSPAAAATAPETMTAGGTPEPAASTAPTATPTAMTPSPTATPSRARPTAQPEPDSSSEHDVVAMVERWRTAWQSKDHAAYMSFYAADFRGDGKDRTGWSAHKRRVFGRASEIEVGVSDLHVSRAGDGFDAVFTQIYTSGRYRDRGRKTLRIEPRDGRLAIVAESFQKSS